MWGGGGWGSGVHAHIRALRLLCMRWPVTQLRPSVRVHMCVQLMWGHGQCECSTSVTRHVESPAAPDAPMLGSATAVSAATKVG